LTISKYDSFLKPLALKILDAEFVARKLNWIGRIPFVLLLGGILFAASFRASRQALEAFS
jgi:hypothetical protein